MNTSATARLSVELAEVTKRFGEVVAVDRVSLAVRKGEFFSLLGPSGCGKTTTLRMVGGLEHPDAGEVRIKGACVNGTPPYERDASIVFQNLALFPHMTVGENVAFGLRMRRLGRAETRAKVEEMLRLVQLDGLAKRRPDQLSGGQQQRVALARSLVLRPEVLLLDEPLAALDRKLRKEMQIELRRIQRDVGITFVYVTHDQKEALSMSDRVAVMKDGRVVQLDRPSALYERPRTRFVADFMGAANVFHGQVVAREPDRLRLRTERGLEVVADATGLNGLGERERLSLSVRPEVVQLYRDAGDAGGDNVYEGRVASVVYFGESVEVEVELQGGERVLAALSPKFKHVATREGAPVWVAWADEDTNVLTD